MIKILVIIKKIKKILTIKVIIIAIIIKCRGRYRTPTTTYTKFLVTLHNGRKSLSSIKKSSASDDVRVISIAFYLIFLDEQK